MNTFVRDKNYTKSLGIGKYRDFKDGDKVRVITSLYFVSATEIRDHLKLFSVIGSYFNKYELWQYRSKLKYDLDDYIRFETGSLLTYREGYQDFATSRYRLYLRWFLKHRDHFERI